VDADEVFVALCMLQDAVAHEFNEVREHIVGVEARLGRRIERSEDRIEEIRERLEDRS
jgi:hypothetical protein